MPTYKVNGTDILHNKTIYPDGSTIELKNEDAERLEDYLEFIKAEPEIPADEVKQEEVKQEEVKQIKPAKPARIRKPQPKPVETKKEPEVQKVSEPTPAVVEIKTTTANQEVKTQEKTQIPPAAKKAIANAITQVNSSIHTPSYQPSTPTNMRAS